MISMNNNNHFLKGVFSITNGIKTIAKILRARIGLQVCSGFEAKYSPKSNWSNLTLMKVQHAPALLASHTDRSDPEIFALITAHSINGGMYK